MIRLNSSDVFVGYSLPDMEDYYLVQQNESVIHHFDFLNMEKGFVVYPFRENEENPAVLIKADKVSTNIPFHFQAEEYSQQSSQEKEEYIHVLQQFISATNTSFEKLVASRIHVIPNDFGNLFEVFLGLKTTYPEAFVYVFNLPGIGSWIGASPEILLKKNKTSMETVALAGTVEKSGESPENTFWGEKEIVEQDIVIKFVEEQIHSLGLPFEKSDPISIESGKVIHRKTNFKIHGTRDFSSLVKKLHPTPAVCGLPLIKAQDFIEKNERFARGYYAGFLGPVDLNNTTAFFVNIRCMEAYANQFVLHVGGGITPESIPEKEWEETELKAQTLLSIIENIPSFAI